MVVEAMTEPALSRLEPSRADWKRRTRAPGQAVPAPSSCRLALACSGSLDSPAVSPPSRFPEPPALVQVQVRPPAASGVGDQALLLKL